MYIIPAIAALALASLSIADDGPTAEVYTYTDTGCGSASLDATIHNKNYEYCIGNSPGESQSSISAAMVASVD